MLANGFFNKTRSRASSLLRFDLTPEGILVTTDKTVWKVQSGVRFRRLFDEAVLIHQQKAQALVLNDTAISFVEGCDGERTVDEIITAMTDDFDVSAEQLAEDLAPFIEQLAAEGIIERVS